MPTLLAVGDNFGRTLRGRLHPRWRLALRTFRGRAAAGCIQRTGGTLWLLLDVLLMRTQVRGTTLGGAGRGVGRWGAGLRRGAGNRGGNDHEDQKVHVSFSGPGRLASGCTSNINCTK